MIALDTRHRSAKVVARLAAYFPSRQGQTDLSSSAWMFADDITKDIMPISGRSSTKPAFAVELNGTKEPRDLACRILQSLSGRAGDSSTGDYADVTCDAVRRVAGRMAVSGSAVYEILRDSEGNQVYRLLGVPTYRLFRIVCGHLQLIPKSDRDFCKRSYSYARNQDVWRISMPSSLGGSRGYRRVFSKLSKFPPFGPEFLTSELNNPAWSPADGVLRYTEQSEYYEAKATSSYGWNRRDYSTTKWTEFYLCLRTLKFKWAQACIREHIVAEINALIRGLGLEVEIVVKGLPTASEIEAIRQSVHEGQMSFRDANEACEIY